MENNKEMSKYNTPLIRFNNIDYFDINMCDIDDDNTLTKSEINEIYLKLKERARDRLECLGDIMRMVDIGYISKNKYNLK